MEHKISANLVIAKNFCHCLPLLCKAMSAIPHLILVLLSHSSPSSCAVTALHHICCRYRFDI